MKRRLVNIMEQIVLDGIDELAPNLECCTCEYCKIDIAALVLNQIAPKYVATESGALFSKLSISNVYDKVDLYKKIVQAANVVKDSPRHPL